MQLRQKRNAGLCRLTGGCPLATFFPHSSRRCLIRGPSPDPCKSDPGPKGTRGQPGSMGEPGSRWDGESWGGNAPACFPCTATIPRIAHIMPELQSFHAAGGAPPHENPPLGGSFSEQVRQSIRHIRFSRGVLVAGGPSNRDYQVRGLAGEHLIPSGQGYRPNFTRSSPPVLIGQSFGDQTLATVPGFMNSPAVAP